MDNIEWVEVTPPPEICRECMEKDCYNCDHTGERWRTSKADELRLRRKGLLKTIERLQRQIAKLDEEMSDLGKMG